MMVQAPPTTASLFWCYYNGAKLVSGSMCCKIKQPTLLNSDLFPVKVVIQIDTVVCDYHPCCRSIMELGVLMVFLISAHSRLPQGSLAAVSDILDNSEKSVFSGLSRFSGHARRKWTSDLNFARQSTLH